MLPPLARTYLIVALEGTPDVLEGLLHDLPPTDPKWDARPDPERFTLREIVAHLAFVEPNWATRAKRTCDEDEPFFPRAAIQSETVPVQTPQATLSLLRVGRGQFVALLKALTDDQWTRVAQSEFLGALTIEQQAMFVCVHDGYHVGQIAQWLKQIA